MKKLVFSLVLVSGAYFAMAQDYSKVTTNYTLKKYEDAKKELDKIASSDKGKDKPETYMWEAAINSELYADSTKAAQYPDAAQSAMTALNTYEQADTSLKSMKETGTLNSIANLYAMSFNEGKKYFGQSDWSNAFSNFQRATELGEFINRHGFNTNKSLIDTFTVLYTGYAAQNANKPADALVYYKKLADLKTGGADLQPMYQYMLDDLSKAGDTEGFKKYMAIAKELYPDQSALWTQMEMQNMTSGSSVDDILAKYKTESGGNMTADQLIGYAEAFNDPKKTNDLDSLKQVELKQVSADIYKKLFAVDQKGIYAYNAGVLNYNIFNMLDDRYYAMRGEGADLKAKREAILKEQRPYADTAIAWLEKSYDMLKAKSDRDASESNSLNRSVDFLANLYMWKRERSKGVAPQDYDKYDAKYNQYADEHDKYKTM